MQYKIAVPLTGPNLDDVMRQGMEAINCGADILEFRLDYISNPNAHNWALLFPSLIRIFTNRHISEAGPDKRAGFRGTEEERIAILQRVADSLMPKAVEHGIDIIDIELEHYHKINVDQSRAKIMISDHNFGMTPLPSELDYVFNTAREKGADIVKMAYMVNSIDESDDINYFVMRNARSFPLVAVGMGEIGIDVRRKSPMNGGLFTFASLNVSQKTAPGQPSIQELRNFWKNNPN